MDSTRIIDAIELPYVKESEKETAALICQAVLELLEKTGVSIAEVDGLGVASFSLAPNRAIDIAWRLSMNLSWLHDDSNGGLSGLNLVQHAFAAIASGQASVIVLVAGDSFDKASFAKLISEYNSTTQNYLAPIGAASPNTLFSFLTQQYQALHGLDKEDFGQVVIQQRQWASLNPNALYRTPLSMDDYLSARAVNDVLGIYDCVPVAAGANALLLVRSDHPLAQQSDAIRIRAFQANHNYDNQQGTGLQTGLAQIQERLWQQAQLTPAEIDVCAVYDDYPVMVLAQLEDLGFFSSNTIHRFIREKIATQQFKLNTSGGQLSCGQAGTAGGLLGVVEVVKQLKNQAQERQVEQAQYGLVTGYGMVQYRYCMCSAAMVLEGNHA